MKDNDDSTNKTQAKTSGSASEALAIAGAFGTASPDAMPPAGGTASATPSGDTVSSHSQSVWDGRLSAAMRENNDLKKRVAELEKRIAEVSASSRAAPDDPDGGDGGADDDSALEEFDEASRKAIGKYVDGKLKRERAKLNDRISRNETEFERMRAERADAARNRTMAEAGREIEAKWPGLCARVGFGGDLCDAWRRFNSTPDPIVGGTWFESLSGAAGRGSVPAVVRVFESFVGSGALSGQFDAAPPATPRPHGSPSGDSFAGAENGGGAQGKVFGSEGEIIGQMDRLDRLFKQGRIDKKAYDEKFAELVEASAQGRFLRK